MSLTRAEVDHYEREGWIAPIDVMSEVEASDLAAELEKAEAAHPADLNPQHRNNAHLAFPFLAEVVTRRAIVSAVNSLVGDDVALWSTVLFIKEPDSSAFVSWHQDAFYMGLEPQNFVTAWLALTPSTYESGCVSVIPRSHRRSLEHTDTFGSDNILTRGQEVAEIDTRQAVHLELRPGQMSLHHPWLVHGSQPNRSAERRVGVAMQSFLGGDVRPARGEHHVLHISGRSVHPSFVVVQPPTETASDRGIATRRAANDAMAAVLYDGATKQREL
ncbi:MAG: phytanoyl-CoA dioxygenase family protein [Acidimicrobiia bacterium]|nr:phytanoyl-CoA dioxygenase family protein [Acidimicrobiia bacterium]